MGVTPNIEAIIKALLEIVVLAKIKCAISAKAMSKPLILVILFLCLRILCCI